MPKPHKKYKKAIPDRPYNPEYTPIIRTIMEIIGERKYVLQAFNIGYDDLKRWENEHQEVRDALKASKTQANARVAGALLKRALGYKYTETKIKVVKGEGDSGEKKYKEITEKELPPDVTACIFWLKNQDPEHWKDVGLIDAGENLTAMLNTAFKKAAKDNIEKAKEETAIEEEAREDSDGNG